MPASVVSLDRITRADEPRAGAKAYNCARLKQAGFPVPDGLVVLSTATDDDLAAVETDRWFDGLPSDGSFAVRSSGIGEDSDSLSFAGIHETRLNLGRANLRVAIEACRASGRSAQALEYRRVKGISTGAIQMAVLIQRMIQPVAAGVAFTINPVTGADSELVINASWGLGEALVGGQLDPDEFVVRKSDGELIWSRIGEKAGAGHSSSPSLAANQVRELATMLTDIEHHYGAPQDVEWCHDGAHFWIVQSRPVTTRRDRTGESEWTRANLVEVLPDITSPQALCAFEEMLNRAERQYMGRLLAPEATLGPMMKSFCGRLYFNLSQLRHVCAMIGFPPALMLRSLGHSGAVQPVDERAARPPIRERLSSVPDIARLAWRHLRASQIVREHEARTCAYLRRLSAMDPKSLSDDELWSVIDRWFHDAPEHLQTVLLLGGVLVHEVPVRKICRKVGLPFEQLVYPQLATGARSVSAQQAFDLVALADAAGREPAVREFLAGEATSMEQVRSALRGTAFVAEFERFLQKYGHRGRYESDWSLPRYNEDPTLLLRALRAHLGAGSETASATVERQAREAALAWTAFEQRLSLWQRWTTLPRVGRSIRKIKQYYVWREHVRSDMVRVLAALRTWHLVLAERFVERGWLNSRDDYFLLQLPEIGRVIDGRSGAETLRDIANDRTRERERHRSLRMPLLMRASELPGLVRMAGVSGASSDQSLLNGHPVSGGCVEAEVVVVRDPADIGRMKRGAILVAPATDPSWTPLFTLASGLIVEVGGVLSHASTIAREYGLPALANVEHATQRLKTGDRVRLDATHGFVQRLGVGE